MVLKDFQEAIDALKSALGEYSYGWTEIKASWDGSRFIFFNESSKSYYVYYRDEHKIEKCYPDTWSNPDHKEIISQGY